MKINETNKLMERIKEHYQDFIIDKPKVEEWHNYLKDYSYKDVSNKLDEHLSSEQYGQYIPKVAFLVKYLTKEEDKGKIEDYKTQCYLCKRYIKNSEYQEHFKRCSSINYMNNQRYKYFGKRFDELTIKQLWKMEEELFRKKYREMLEIVRDNTTDAWEKERVTALLENRGFTIQTELLKDMIKNATVN